MGHFSPGPVLLTPQRRNSLPPLPSISRQNSWMLPEIYESENFSENPKLPLVESESSSRPCSSRPAMHYQAGFNPYRIPSPPEMNEIFRIVDIGDEEAEGASQNETLVLSNRNRSPEFVEYLSISNPARFINLCGNVTRSSVEYEKSSQSIETKPGPLKLPTNDARSLTMKGNKAQYQHRPVISQTSVFRPLIAKRNRLQVQKNVPTRSRRDDIMVSMEERLARSAKAKKSQNSNRKSKKSKRAKTAAGLSKPKVRRNLCLLTCIKPQNLDEEKAKFFQSNFTYNPQFKYEYPANENILKRFSKASSKYVPQAEAIMKRVLDRYGNYEKFEAATGGQLLTKTQLWNTVKKYLEKEGFYGDVVVNISNDLIARAAMTVTGGRPTLSIKESAAKKLWVEGLLRHEIGTHHLRFHNNRQQVWASSKVRRQMGLKPANPTEEGLASLHSVLMRKDPALWRSAILYYTVFKASQMSFCDLFKNLEQFVENPEVRWDYCLRSKRGQYDTSRPGCFCKDQVYLTGILQILQVRHSLDFHLLCCMGKVSYEDIEMLRPHFNSERTKIPSFMQDVAAYRERLDFIVEVNGLEVWLEQSAKEKEGGDEIYEEK